MARRHTDPKERRGDRRIVLRRRAIVAMSVPPADDHTPAVVFDISCTGIGLLAMAPVEAGCEIALTWEFGPKRYHRIIQATVVHATATRDGAWRVGCVFAIPLDAPEVRAFLRYCAKL